ncbi:hypothetical protein [Dactylosporangium sp. NPDC048998]|uniref:hypothetical protein n=1 Tax=Dactylosporangium sp. NPDC048998 TaxID=3363976 RepID=UPI0037122944
MSRKLLLVVAGIVVLAAIGVTVYLVRRGPDGAASPESAVSEYVAALKAHDRGRLENIADPDHDAGGEISNRLEQFGDNKLMVTSTSIGDTESDATKRVDVVGTVNGAPFTEQLWLYRHDHRWFVALGPNRNAHPKET